MTQGYRHRSVAASLATTFTEPIPRKGRIIEVTTLHLLTLGGYILGAALLVWGGTGLLRELTGRQRKIAVSTLRVLQGGSVDLQSLKHSSDIHAENQLAFERILRLQANGGPDVYTEIERELRDMEIRAKEMQLQSARGEEATETISEAMADLDEGLHGIRSGSLDNQAKTAQDAKAARDLGERTRLARRDSWITFGGLLLTTAASCGSLFIPS